MTSNHKLYAMATFILAGVAIYLYPATQDNIITFKGVKRRPQ